MTFRIIFLATLNYVLSFRSLVPIEGQTLLWLTESRNDQQNTTIENKGNNEITELRTILQRESQNS